MSNLDTIRRGWNNAGPEITADLLSSVLCEINSNRDVERHNVVIGIIKSRIEPTEQNIWRLAMSMANLIEQLSLEALGHGAKTEIKT